MWKFKKSKKTKKQSVLVEEVDNDVILPSNVMEKLKIQDQEKAMLRIDGQRVLIEFVNRHANAQSVLLTWFLVPAILSTIVFVLYFINYKQIDLVGDPSISMMTFILGLVTGIGSFVYFFIQGKRGEINTASKDIYWRNFPAVLVSFSVILVFALMLAFKGMDLLFGGASFDLFTSTFLFFMFICIINYFMIKMSITITPSTLTTILIVVIIGGVVSAMVMNSEQQWWQYNFSFLGTPTASNSWQFNITLIFSAMLMIALIDYLFVMIKKAMPKSKRLMTLRILLILTALCLGGVGLFPYNEIVYFQKIHDLVARAMVVLIIIIIIGLRWLLPKVSKEFLKLSYLIGAALVVTTVLFLGVGYLSLTAFELVAFILAFAWILMLLQNLQKLAITINNTFDVIVRNENPTLEVEEDVETETIDELESSRN